MKCKEDNCNTRASFNLLNENKPIYNLPNTKIAIYCKEHSKVGMVDIKSKKCLEKECDTQASFNFSNEKIGIYCSKHKKENMINIKSKRCLEEYCDKQPNFNLPNENYGIYCKTHKKLGIVRYPFLLQGCMSTNFGKSLSFSPNELV